MLIGAYVCGTATPRRMLPNAQMTDGSAWMDVDRFEIDKTVDEPTTDTRLPSPGLARKVQRLLENLAP